MSDYKHGAYSGKLNVAEKLMLQATTALVYVGTAPVQQVRGYAASVNKPIVLRSLAEAKKYFGYSDNWADYTLMEPIRVHFELTGVAPIVLINVLNPATHKSATKTTETKTPASGVVTIANAQAVILDTIVVKVSDTTKTEGTDYSLAYDKDSGVITIAELTSGALSTSCTVEYYSATPSAVTANDVIGATDNEGVNTGLYAVKDVYQKTGLIPGYILAPGFSGEPTVHTAMLAVSQKIAGHWDAWLGADIPITSGGTAVTFATAKTWKDTNGYTAPNENVYFPLAKGIDGKTYHLSVLAAANFQLNLYTTGGIPYKTASNTVCGCIQNLYLGAGTEDRVYDDELINEKLNKNGICSAAYIGGAWRIWGNHAAQYDQTNKDNVNVSSINRMMLYYISNDFQSRRAADVDRVLTANDIKSIIADEQARLDALVQTGALTYGKVSAEITEDDYSDVINGNFTFVFEVTATPLARSLTAVVNWTDAGLETFFEGYIM